MSGLDEKVLTARITEYLSLGGLFNPEMANHDAVRDLLIDCRDELSRLRARLETVEAETRERCAITAETHWLTICGELSQHRERHEHGLGIAAAIRALSQEGSEPS